MDLTMIADFIGSLDPLMLGGVAGGFLVAGVAGLYVKKNKNKFIENTDSLAQSNDFKTLKTEDLEREFGNLTVQTKMLDDDESLFFDKSSKDKLNENLLAPPSISLVNEASVFDNLGKQDKALQLLKQAIDIEQHDKEKVRLKILLSQYNIKKGNLSLSEIIEQNPSFHNKTVLDNNFSELTVSSITKTDNALLNSGDKKTDKVFDLFADLPMVHEPDTSQNVSEVDINKNLVDHLPITQEVNYSSDNTSCVKPQQSYFFESINKPVDTLDNLPSDNIVEPKNNDITTPMFVSDNNFSEMEKNDKNPEFDHFTFDSNQLNHNMENTTENMLKQLQEEAEKTDKFNDNEAMEDMQKFWKEFGNMVVDIKKEVHENQQVEKDHTITYNTLPFNEKTNEVLQQECNKDQQTTVIHNMYAMTNDFPELSETSLIKHVEQPSALEYLEPPVLHDIIPSPILSPVNLGVSPMHSLPLPVSVAKEEALVATTNVPENAESLNSSMSNLAPVNPELITKPQTYKVWANWIVTIEDKQIFKNHFINLKNPWGTIKSGEELYGGISRLSGKDSTGKNYPWVLVSVFPLSKE